MIWVGSLLLPLAGEAIVSSADRSLLTENGGPVTFSKNWAKYLLYRLNFVKRRGSSTAQVTVQNYEVLRLEL